jgi:uncharacterized protein (TIGR02453 family)
MFTPRTLAFLRALARHNTREWFRQRRDQYDEHVRGPMIVLIEKLAVEFAEFAPELVASPKVSLYRVYRDTRFSPDKSPLKTHVAAVFPWRGLARHEGAGLYVEVAPSRVLVGGGIYAPRPQELRTIRERVEHDFGTFRAIVEAPAFRKAFGAVEGERLQRVPLGFRSDSPAAEYLKLKQYLVGREYAATFAHHRRFLAELVARFKQMVPLVRFLNEPLVGQASSLDLVRGNVQSAPARRKA